MNIPKSRKALSPVVASIILIAVTVAVSIAVAAWMGALTFSFTATEQVSITNMGFNTDNLGLNVSATNSGTSTVTINEVWVNNVKLPQSQVTETLPATIPANNQTVFHITGYTINAGYSYQAKLVSSKGNIFLYTATAPS